LKENFRGLSVDLNKLADTIEHYMDREGFETNLDRTPEWYRIQAMKKGLVRTAVGAQRCIEVNIRGDPNAFEVEMATGEWGKNLVAGAVLGAVTLGLGWVGAGISAVTYRKLEEKIFDYIHWQIDELKGTAAGVPVSMPQPNVVSPASSPLAPQCPRCKGQVKPEFNTCPFCGFNLRLQQLQCPKCTSPVEPSYLVCPNCGVRLGSALARETL
jgi:RNA polymerase subunit RPABC4/transcription elongation factor Spt4